MGTEMSKNQGHRFGYSKTSAAGVYLWFQYTPNSFWAQWVASPWAIPIYFIGPDSHSLECPSGNRGKALPPRRETGNHAFSVTWLHLCSLSL